jgi:hypothetical protein
MIHFNNFHSKKWTKKIMSSWVRLIDSLCSLNNPFPGTRKQAFRFGSKPAVWTAAAAIHKDKNIIEVLEVGID